MSLDLQSDTQLWLGAFEREIGSWLCRFAQGVAVGIDVGAGNGEYTLFLLLRTKAKQVVAFEPDPDCIELLRLNLSLNHLVASERLVIVTSPAGKGPTEISLDSLDIHTSGPCLIKIDVEGHEASVLRSAARLLRRKDVRLIIETHSADVEGQCLAILGEANFVTQVVGQAGWRALLPENRPIAHNRWLVAWKRQESGEGGFAI